MDWTGYPLNIDPAEDLLDRPDLARFLGDTGYGFTATLLDTIAAAEGPDRDRLTAAFPRESVAYYTWVNTEPTPTGAELVNALSVIPEPAPEQPAGDLVQVQLDRCMIVGLPSTGQASVTLKHRSDDSQPWRQTQYIVPTPAVELDPSLLTAMPAPGRLSMRLTLANPS